MSILNYISDSIAHLVDGLEKLTDNLLEEGVTAFQAVARYIVDSWGGDPDLLRLLLRKGVFPYTYLTSIDRLEETKLPPKTAFFNNLTEKKCSDGDYTHAETVFEKFRMRKLRDYSDLYVVSDVLLLTDIFTRYREESLTNYGLDPLHYFTSPGMALIILNNGFEIFQIVKFIKPILSIHYV